MGYGKKFVFISFILLLSGCAVLSRDKKFRQSYEQGYKQGVKENISDFAGSFYGNDFPYFVWSAPVVQNVRVPARLENGMFVPEHNELVMIEPGEWRNNFTYPINSGIKNNKKTQQAEGDENYALSYFDFDVGDITVLPKSYNGVKRAGKDKDID